ncbi:MAG: hypothetical protein WCD86_09090, partial [Ktedonobacteraceae bacterium]
IFVPLVAFFDRYGTDATNEQLRDLQRWVYMALIWSRYSGSSETAMDQDLSAFSKEQPIQAMIQNIENDVGRQRPVTERELRDQKKSSPFMLMVYVLARRNHAQDWFSGVVIGSNHDMPLHNIFPPALLGQTHKSTDDSHHQVANLIFLATPIDKNTAKHPPSANLANAEEQRLKDQYMPLQRELWELDQFEECMRQRRTMLADAINQFLLSLTDGKRLWASTSPNLLEIRIDALEHQLRKLVALRLYESRGDNAWDQLVPANTRISVKGHIGKKEGEQPFIAGQHETLEAKLKFCLFSDNMKIIKANWLLFQDVFGKETMLDQYANFATNARNALKHSNDLSNVDLASAEAGLLWFEECLSHVKLETEGEEIFQAEAV